MLNKIKNIALIVLIVGMVGGAWYLISQNKTLKANLSTAKSNTSNALREKTSAIVELDLEKKEFLEYIKSRDNQDSQLNGLIDKLSALEIDLKRVKKIVSTKVEARDTTLNIINLDSLAQKVKLNQQFTIPFNNKTKCFDISGTFNYKDGISSISINDRQFNDTINYIYHWERKQWKFLFIKSRLFGKKQLKDTVISNCGNVKTLIIKQQ